MHHFVTNLSYVGNSAAAFGERERTAIFSAELRRFFCARKELKLVFRLEFLVLFFQEKRIIKSNLLFE
jgi:hypothetical protein